MDLIKQLGELAIGSRLKRLSEYIFSHGVDTYKLYGIDFNPHWFPVYYALTKKERMGIMELASQLELSHPAIIKLAKELEAKGYVQSEKDAEDRRKRLLSLTDKGREILPEMELAWKDMAQSLSSMMGAHTNNILGALSDFELDFQNRSFIERVKSTRVNRLLNEVKIIDYKPEYADQFKRINYAWIEKYFKIESLDIDALENHKEKILDNGGWIFFAKIGKNIVGTCALVKSSSELYELAKMGVDEEYRGLQIGKKLGQAILDKAKDLGAKKVFLESNKTLTPAIRLYERLGFKEVNYNASSEYERSNIKMEIEFE